MRNRTALDWPRLLRRAQARDESAFETLMRRLKPELSAYLSSRRVRTPLGDLLCMAFSALWERLPRADCTRSPNDLKNWCWMVAVNAARDIERQADPDGHGHRRRPRSLTDVLGEQQDASGKATTAGETWTANAVTPRLDRLDARLDNTLRMYHRYIRDTGSLKHAHRVLAARRGVSERQQAAEFKASAARYKARAAVAD